MSSILDRLKQISLSWVILILVLMTLFVGNVKNEWKSAVTAVTVTQDELSKLYTRQDLLIDTLVHADKRSDALISEEEVLEARVHLLEARLHAHLGYAIEVSEGFWTGILCDTSLVKTYQERYDTFEDQ